MASSCCNQASTPQVLHVPDDTNALSPIDSKTAMPHAARPDLSGSACSLLSCPPLMARDLKGIVIELRNECEAAAIRQEAFLKEVLHKQKEVYQEMLAVRSDQAEAHATLRQDLLAQFGISPTRIDNSKVAMVGAIDLQMNTAGNGQAAATGKKADETGEKQPELNHGSMSQITLSHDASAASRMSQKGTEPTPKGSQMVAQRSGTKNERGTLTFAMSEDVHAPLEMNWCARLDRNLRRKEFELLVAGAILANSIVMSFECQYSGLMVGFNLKVPGRSDEAHVVWPGADTAFKFFDWFFGMLFFFEFVLKAACWRKAYFCEAWNLVDFGCVVAFGVDKAMAGASAINPHMLRLLRLIRLARLVRLIRFLESLEALYVMTTAIAGLSKILGWAVFLLSIILVTCDLFLVQMLQATYFSDVHASDLSQPELDKHHKMYRYFGTCTRCILSMFEITMGNWPPIARLLADEVSEWFIIFCLLHKLTVGFAVMGVITGVILQETFKVAHTDDVIMLRQKRRASTTLREKMRALFYTLDVDENDRVDFQEFCKICQDPNIKTWLASLDIETDDLGTLFDLCDINNDGTLSFTEVADRMPRIRGAARGIDVWALKKDLVKSVIETEKDLINQVTEHQTLE